MKESLQLIIDYLENPSIDLQQDSARRAKLCSSLGLNPASKPGVLGEKIIAVIERQGVISKNDIKNYLSDKLQRLKIPEVIHFVDSMPKTPSGKIFKRKLKDMLPS